MSSTAITSKWGNNNLKGGCHCSVLSLPLPLCSGWTDKTLAKPSSPHSLPLPRILLLWLYHDLLSSGLCQRAQLSVRPFLIHPHYKLHSYPSGSPYCFSLLYLFPHASYDHPIYWKCNLLVNRLSSLNGT